MKTAKRNGRNQKGQGLVEVSVVSGVVMVPLVLFMLDLIFLYAANTLNDQYVKVAARAAASQSTPAGAEQAARSAIAKFPTSALITNLEVTKVEYRTPQEFGAQKTVVVTTKMATVVPMPFPFLNEKPVFEAGAVEPITALPPNPHADS
jgi:hypothetical protein